MTGRGYGEGQCKLARLPTLYRLVTPSEVRKSDLKAIELTQFSLLTAQTRKVISTPTSLDCFGLSNDPFDLSILFCVYPLLFLPQFTLSVIG